MKTGSVLSLVIVVVVLTAASPAEGVQLTDPYEILEAHYAAVGGLERLREQDAIHFVADISVAGLSGTLEHWGLLPDRSRDAVDLGVLTQVNGDNGTDVWTLDTNGMLQFERDANALGRREAVRRLALFEHLDRDSDVFTVELVGTREIEGDLCHVLRMESTVDNAMRLWFISTTSLLMRRSEVNHPDEQEHIVYSDFREIDGVIRPFRQDVTIEPVGQKQTIMTTSFDSGVEIDASIFDPPEGGARDFTFARGGYSAEVPFRYIENHIFVPVNIGGEESLWVLDSGASVSVIDRAYAEELGLPLSGEILAESASDPVALAFTTLPPFAVGDIEFEEQQVAALDFVDLFRRASDLEVLGILGYDFLSRFVTRVDYANTTLTLYDSDGFEYSGEGNVLDAPLSDNLFRAEATLDGVYSGQWMLDLGAGGMSFETSYVKAHGLGSRKAVSVVGFGAGGRMLRYRSRYETIEFGGYAVEEPEISRSYFGADARSELREGQKAGNLGNSLFRHFVLYLDYYNQQIIVEKGDNFGKRFPKDRSGLGLWRPDEACEVLHVAPGTPAEEAGLREGDVLVAVNGTGVDEYGTLVELRELLAGEAGTEYTFTVERDGQELELTLLLRDLFDEVRE